MGTSDDARGRGTQRGAKVSESVAREILEDVVARGLPPGTKLPPEAQMLETFRVGRASLREALRILEVHGLIRVRPGPGGGPVLADVDAADFGRTATFFFHARRARVHDLLEARLVLEPLMARLAAERVTAEVRDLLRANLASAELFLDDPGPRWGQLAGEFHALVTGLSGNPVLDLLAGSLNAIHTDRVRPMFPVGGRDGVLRAHRRIAESIMDGDADRAEQLTWSHVQDLVARLAILDPTIPDTLIDWS